MRRVLVIKHVAQENLGALKPLLSAHGVRIKYVNFGREPDASPSLEKYQGLIILGGGMGVYEADRYRHIKLECQLIEQALHRQIPVLGICLGAQILAHTLGAEVKKHSERECGWGEVELTKEGRADKVFAPFAEREKVLQMHGDTFDLPQGAALLARSSVCEHQAFSYPGMVYGIQFHLEMDQTMVKSLLHHDRESLLAFAGEKGVHSLEKETDLYLPRSLKLAKEVFGNFLGFSGVPERPKLTRSSHGK